MGVALVHPAAAPVADMGQDNRFGYHPGQALEGVMGSPVPEDRFRGLLHHRDAAAEKPIPQPWTLRRPRAAKPTGPGGAMAAGGAHGEKVAHLQVPLVEKIPTGNDEKLTPAPVRIGKGQPVVRVTGETACNRGQHQGLPQGLRRLIEEHLAMVEKGEGPFRLPGKKR